MDIELIVKYADSLGLKDYALRHIGLNESSSNGALTGSTSTLALSLEALHGSTTKLIGPIDGKTFTRNVDIQASAPFDNQLPDQLSSDEARRAMDELVRVLNGFPKIKCDRLIERADYLVKGNFFGTNTLRLVIKFQAV